MKGVSNESRWRAETGNFNAHIHRARVMLIRGHVSGILDMVGQENNSTQSGFLYMVGQGL